MAELTYCCGDLKRLKKLNEYLEGSIPNNNYYLAPLFRSAIIEFMKKAEDGALGMNHASEIPGIAKNFWNEGLSTVYSISVGYPGWIVQAVVYNERIWFEVSKDNIILDTKMKLLGTEGRIKKVSRSFEKFVSNNLEVLLENAAKNLPVESNENAEGLWKFYQKFMPQMSSENKL